MPRLIPAQFSAKPAAVLLVMLALITVINACLPVHAYDGNDPAASSHRRQASSTQHKRASLFDQLGLSDEQKKAMHDIREENRVKAKAIHDRLQSLRQELRTLMTAPDADKSQAVSLQKEIAGLQNQMEELRLKTWFAMKEKMTPEQLNKLKRIRQAARMRRERMQKGRSDSSRSGGTKNEH